MKRFAFLVIACAIFATGCASAPQARFYLVSDPEGHVGEAVISNQVSTVTLDKPNQTVSALFEDKPFSSSRQADPEEIQTKFGDALAAMPASPKSFNIFFDMGSNEVKAESKGVAAEVLAESLKRDSRDISLNGHTDRMGDAAVNMQLSMERAETVKALLMQHGIKSDYISIEFYGECKPLVPTPDNVQEPRNRRVEVVVR